jgi:hypothetical protein
LFSVITLIVWIEEIVPQFEISDSQGCEYENGTNKLPNPPVRIDITMKKVITYALARAGYTVDPVQTPDSLVGFSAV